MMPYFFMLTVILTFYVGVCAIKLMGNTYKSMIKNSDIISPDISQSFYFFKAYTYDLADTSVIEKSNANNVTSAVVSDNTGFITENITVSL